MLGTIKQELINNLEDLTLKFDHNNSDNQHIELESKVNDNYGKVYHLLVELTAITRSEYIQSDYFSGDNPGYIYEIEDIRIEHIYLFKNDSDGDISINENEIYNHLKSTL